MHEIVSVFYQGLKSFCNSEGAASKIYGWISLYTFLLPFGEEWEMGGKCRVGMEKTTYLRVGLFFQRNEIITTRRKKKKSSKIPALLLSLFLFFSQRPVRKNNINRG